MGVDYVLYKLRIGTEEWSLFPDRPQNGHDKWEWYLEDYGDITK